MFWCNCKPDRTFLDARRLRVDPIDYLRAIDRHADMISLSQDFEVVPIVLVAHLLRRAAVDGQAQSAIQIVHAPARGEHHQVTGIRVFVVLLRRSRPQKAMPECMSDFTSFTSAMMRKSLNFRVVVR